MDGKRLGFVGIVIEERAMAAKVNEILSAFGGIIRGRLGVPDPQTGNGVISLIVEGSNDQLGAMTGRLGISAGRYGEKRPGESENKNGKVRKIKMKRFLSALMALCLVLSLSACAVAEDAVRVYALMGPTGHRHGADDGSERRDVCLHPLRCAG